MLAHFQFFLSIFLEIAFLFFVAVNDFLMNDNILLTLCILMDFLTVGPVSPIPDHSTGEFR